MESCARLRLTSPHRAWCASVRVLGSYTITTASTSSPSCNWISSLIVPSDERCSVLTAEVSLR